MEKSTECMTDLPIISDEGQSKCPECRGAGVLYKYYKAPSIYPPNCAPVLFTETCKRCGGKKDSYVADNKNRLKLPYYLGLSAFNPSA